MTGNELFREIGLINEQHIVEAEETRRSMIYNAVFRRGLATAACLVICVGVYWGTQHPWKSADSTGSAMEYAFDTAMEGAAMEEETENVPQEAAEPEAYSALTSEDSMPVETGEEELKLCEEEASNDEICEGIAAQEESISVTEDAQTQVQSKMAYDYAAVKARLGEYSNDLQELCEAEAYVILHGTVENGEEQWTAFMEAVEVGVAANIDVISFTIEGDAVIDSLYYDGASFYLVHDNSRDAFAGNDKGVSEYQFEELRIQNIETQESILQKEAVLLNAQDEEKYILFRINVTE